jgi:hypothetical protein
MKEKLRALWAKIAPKVEPVFARVRAVWDKVFPHIRRHGRWAAYLVVIPLIFAFIAGLGFFWIYPAYELRPWVTQKLVSELRAQSLRVGDMSWSHSLKNLSLGVELRDVEIQRGTWFHSLKVDELRLSFSPVSLVMAGTPFNLEASGLDAHLRFDGKSDAPVVVQPDAELTPSTKSEQLVEWTRQLMAYAKGYKIRLERSKLQLQIADVRVNLLDLELDADLDASWRQRLELSALIQTGSENGSWVLAGPFSLESRSVLTVRGENKIPVALDFSSFDLDLSRTNFTGGNIFERFSPGRFVLHASPRILFREEGSEVVLGDLTSGKAHAFLDDLKIDLDSRYQPGKEFELQWIVGRSEVKELHLPVKWIRRSPGSGIVSSSGRLHVRDRLDNSDFVWRLSLNNFKLDATHLAALLGDKKSASGPVVISAVSEGRLQNGRLLSPRTEVQLHATQANWDPPSSFFVKPADTKTELLVRMSHDDEGLKVSNFDLELHSLKVEGRGALKNLLGWAFQDEPASFDMSVLTNNIDLSDWSSLFPSFRKVPLQGFFQAKANLSGTLDPKVESPWPLVNWSFDKFHFSNVKGTFAKGSAGMDIAGLRQDLNGPFEMSFFFVGRGQGSRVHRATLLGQLNLGDASVWLGDTFRKPQGVPLELQISADQSQNRVDIDKGHFQFADLDMNFSGQMVQGSGRSRLKVLLKQPVDLATWKDFFPDAKIQERVKGRVWLDGSLGLDSNFRSEKDIDWSTLTFDGQSRFENFSWHSPLLGNSFDSISGKLRFTDRSIEFAPVQIFKGQQSFRLEGSLTPEPIGNKKIRSLYLIDWFLNPAWNLQANVQIPQIELSSLLEKLESRDRYKFPDSWTKSTWAKGSRANVNLDIGSIQWESRELFTKLLGQLEYNRGRSTLRPFSLNYEGGKLKGSATLDLSPTWTNDGDPQWAASVSLESFPVKALPFHLGLSKGVVKGEGTFTSQGRYFADWVKAARLRGLLQVAGIEATPWTLSLREKIDAFFDKSAASDYLLSDAVRAECMPVPESALVEFQETTGKLELGRVRLALKGGGRLDLQANVTDPTYPTAARLRGKAKYRFPSRCFSDRAQFCVRELEKDLSWPLDFSQGESSWTKIEYDFDTAAFGKSFQACMVRRVASDVKKQISSGK